MLGAARRLHARETTTYSEAGRRQLAHCPVKLRQHNWDEHRPLGRVPA